MAEGILCSDAIHKKLLGFSHSVIIPLRSSSIVFIGGEAIVTTVDAVLWRTVVFKCDFIAWARLLCLNRDGNECGSDGEGDSAKHCFVVVFVVVFVLDY